MESITVLTILFVVSIILLVVFFFTSGRNAVWGGAILGLFIGLGVGLVRGDMLNSIMWGVSIGTFLGFAAELLGKVGDSFKKD